MDHIKKHIKAIAAKNIGAERFLNSINVHEYKKCYELQVKLTSETVLDLDCDDEDVIKKAVCEMLKQLKAMVDIPYTALDK